MFNLNIQKFRYWIFYKCLFFIQFGFYIHCGFSLVINNEQSLNVDKHQKKILFFYERQKINAGNGQISCNVNFRFGPTRHSPSNDLTGDYFSVETPQNAHANTVYLQVHYSTRRILGGRIECHLIDLHEKKIRYEVSLTTSTTVKKEFFQIGLLKRKEEGCSIIIQRPTHTTDRKNILIKL